MTTYQYHDELAKEQLEAARAYLALVREGAGIQFPWRDLKDMVGNIMPGWLCVIGGRAKAGKTTLLLGLADYLLDMKIPYVYVGTETEPGILKIKLAAQRLGISVPEAVTGQLSEADQDRLDKELVWIATRSNIAMFSSGGDTLEEFRQWVDFAVDNYAKVVLFDYFQRLDTGPGDRYPALFDAIRQIKNMARDSGIAIIAGAQLHAGSGTTGDYKVPGSRDWFGGQGPQMESDVALQVWRPFNHGVKADQIRLAEQGDIEVSELIQPNTMSVRVAGHRWNGDAIAQRCRLTIRNDRVSDHIGIVA